MQGQSESVSESVASGSDISFVGVTTRIGVGYGMSAVGEYGDIAWNSAAAAPKVGGREVVPVWEGPGCSGPAPSEDEEISTLGLFFELDFFLVYVPSSPNLSRKALNSAISSLTKVVKSLPHRGTHSEASSGVVALWAMEQLNSYPALS